MSRKPVPKRRTWTKLHLSFYLTPSHAGAGVDFFALVPAVFCLARWDGESEHGEVRNENGEAVSLFYVAGLVGMPIPRARKALAVAVDRGTLAHGPDGVIVVPNFRQWQLDPRTLRWQRQQERERHEQEREDAEQLEREREAARVPCRPVDSPPPDDGAHHEAPPSRTPGSMRSDLEALKRRHADFLEALPEGPRRLRAVWFFGTPTELALGLRREVEWVAQALYRGELEPARRLVFEVFEHAWRQAYEGQLSEKWLAGSLWGQGFRARVREWADAQRDAGSPSPSGASLTWEQLAELAREVAVDHRQRLGGAKGKTA